MNESDTITREALAQQLAALEKLQREVAEKLRDHDEEQQLRPIAPWLARRGATKSVADPRTLPPWLARRSH